MIRKYIIIFIALLMSGCGTPYMADRSRDALDIVTATAGEGIGGKVHAGPLQAGIMLNGAETGLRGGEFIKSGALDTADTGLLKSIDALYMAYGLETFEGGPLAPERGKTLHAITLMYVTVPVPESLVLRRPSPRPSGVHARYNPIVYWTQIEAAFGIVGTVRFGINAGEIIDFILGWTTLDIFGDDIENRIKKNAIEHAGPADPSKAVPGTTPDTR